MEIWDGYYKDGTPANVDLIRGEPVPDGLYHLVCEVLVRHIDGDYLLMQRDLNKDMYAGFYEATAGGSALKGENKFDCIKRELFEETGILCDKFEEIAYNAFEDGKSLFHSFLCSVDCDKQSVKLQKGETVSFKWISEDEFIEFIHSGKMIYTQKRRYINWFNSKGYISVNETAPYSQHHLP